MPGQEARGWRQAIEPQDLGLHLRRRLPLSAGAFVSALLSAVPCTPQSLGCERCSLSLLCCPLVSLQIQTCPLVPLMRTPTLLSCACCFSPATSTLTFLWPPDFPLSLNILKQPPSSDKQNVRCPLSALPSYSCFSLFSVRFLDMQSLLVACSHLLAEL